MNKSDILALINKCAKKIEEALKKETLSASQREKLEKLLKSTQYHADIRKKEYGIPEYRYG